MSQELKTYNKAEVLSNYKQKKNFMVPNDWNVAKFQKYIDFLTDFEANGSFADVKKNVTIFDEPNYAYYVRATDIENKNYDQNVKYVDEHSYNFLKKTKLFGGELLITKRGQIGKVYRTPDLNRKMTLGPNMYLIKLKEDIADSNYMYYYFISGIGNSALIRNSASTTLGALYKDDVKKIDIALPPIDQQKKIVRIVSTWDKTIELKEKLIEQKKEQRKGLMQKLLAGEVRLPGFEGEWEEIRLGDYLIKHNEKSEYSDQYPVLTSSRRGIFLQKDYYLGNEVASKDNTGYNVVPYGYFTYRHMSDDVTFKFNINNIVEKGIVSTLYPVFTTKNLNSKFLLLKLNEGNEFKRFALMQKQGGSRTYMYFTKLEELKLTVPSLEEQDSIAEVFLKMDKQISLLETEVSSLKEQKKGLMQLLLTGKVRVKV